MPSLGGDSTNQEDARIASMRARNEQRRERFLDARNRAIGVDVAALEAQIQEKQDERASHSHDNEREIQQLEYISMIVEQREAEERDLKKQEVDLLRDYWDGQKRQPKNECAKTAPAVKPEETGLAALQVFAGEDDDIGTRVALQAQQIRSWSLQQQSEKQGRKNEEADEDMRYSEYMNMVKDARSELEEAERIERDSQTKAMQSDNTAQAEAVRQRAAALKDRVARSDEHELQKMLNDQMLCEDTSTATSMLGEGRIRPDHFKGFSPAVHSEFYKQNAAIIDEKQRSRAHENDEDIVFASQQEALTALVADVEYSAQAEKQKLDKMHQQQLVAQAGEQAKMRQQEKANAFGQISGGLMDGFGCSWR